MFLPAAASHCNPRLFSSTPQESGFMMHCFTTTISRGAQLSTPEDAWLSMVFCSFPESGVLLSWFAAEGKLRSGFKSQRD